MLDFLTWLIFNSITAFLGMCLIISIVQMTDKKIVVKCRLVDCLASILIFAFLVLWVYVGIKSGVV